MNLKQATEIVQQTADSPRDDVTVQGAIDRRAKYNQTGGTYENERYGEASMQLYFRMRARAIVDSIKTSVEGVTHPSIVEIGCGTGLTLEQVAMAFPDARMTGMDISQTMLEQGLSKPTIQEHDCRLVIGSAFCMPFADGSFDAAYSTRFIHQFNREEKQQIFSELKRVVKPGGLILTEFYSSTFADWYENSLGSKRHKPKDRYRMKFPSKAEVHALVGDETKRINLSICGARYWEKVVGSGLLESSTNLLGRLPLPGVVNEYFIAQTNR